MGRAPCCDKANVKKGPWSPEEDAKLKEFIEKFGTGGNWIALPQKAGLKRCGKSCRLRWLNYLRPNIRHGEFSDDEDRIIYSLYASIGSRWSVIAAQLPGRTDNDIKNYWNTKLKKKLLTMLPSLQEKPSFFPSSQSFQIQPPPYDHHQFLNTSSSFINNYNTPNFMNLDCTSNPLFVHDNRINVTDLSPPPPPPPSANNPISLMMASDTIDVNDTCYNFQGFLDDHYNIYNGSAMFGNTTCSSSEGGSSMSQVSHGYQIKQEVDQMMTLHGDQIQTQSFMINQRPKDFLINVEEVNHLNLNGYLFNGGEGNKATSYQKGMCSYYY